MGDCGRSDSNTCTPDGTSTCWQAVAGEQAHQAVVKHQSELSDSRTAMEAEVEALKQQLRDSQTRCSRLQAEEERKERLEQNVTWKSEGVALLREIDQMQGDLGKILQTEARMGAELEAERERVKEQDAGRWKKLEGELREGLRRERRGKEELEEELAASIRLREVLKEELKRDLHKVCCVCVWGGG